MAGTKPIKNAVSYVIYNADRSAFFIVLRSDDDLELPNVWGLPAGTVKAGESQEEAARRALKEKLGVEGDVVRFISEGSTERKEYTLLMKLYEVRITKGEPKGPQEAKGVTQYKALRLGTSEDLREAASKGSLCCRLYLESREEAKYCVPHRNNLKAWLPKQ